MTHWYANMMPSSMRRFLDRLNVLFPVIWPLLALTASVAVFFVVVGGLKGWAGVLGLAGFTASLVVWPQIFGLGADVQRASVVARPGGTDGITWPAIIAAIPDPSMLVDNDGRVIAANDPAKSSLGVQPGRPISSAVRVPEFLSAIDRAYDKQRPQGLALRIPGPVDQRLRGLVSPIARVDGGPLMLIVLRDRTEEQQLSEMRADFVANASHELRTPLASLKGFIETLQGAAKDDPAARVKFLGIMEEQAGRMTRLIDDLLSLSRIEMHEHVVPRARADLAEIVTTAANGLSGLAQREGRTLSVDTGEGPVFVTGDRDELLQVMQNLIQNAIKYGRKDGRVDVKVARDGGRIAVSVEDDGIGIAPEHLPRLTERFYRVSAKDSRDRGGTGLGLAIVKHIVNRHRGDLRVTSQPQKGSRFTVILPLAGATEALEAI